MAGPVEIAIALTAKDAASAVLKNVTEKFKGLSAVTKLVTAGIALTATAVTSVVGTLTALATKSAAAAFEVSKFKRETGLSAEAASKLSFIGNRLGVDVEGLSKAFGVFSKNISLNTKQFQDLHVQLIKSKDGQVDLQRTIESLAERFKSMPDGVEKTGLAMQLFGKSGKDMIPILNQGKEGLKELGAEADRLGLVFDDKALAASNRLIFAQKDLSENIEGLGNRIGMTFVPILADASGALLSFATAVLPVVSAGLQQTIVWIKDAIQVGKEVYEVFTRKDPAAGGFLASLIGKKQADDFMTLVNNVRIQWQLLWLFQIRPAIEWAQVNIPVFWDKFKTAVTNFWLIVGPKLAELRDGLDAMKDKFENLPAPVQHWAEATVAATVAVKATGMDQTFSNWAQGIAGVTQASGGLIGAFTAMGATALVAGAEFAILLAAIGIVIFVGSHLDDLVAAWGYFVDITRIRFAQWADFFTKLWGGILTFFEGVINGFIDRVNLFIRALDLIPGVNIPLISHIKIELPNADNVEKTLDNIARDRSAVIYAHVGGEGANGPMLTFAEGTPFVPRTGPAIIHRGEAVIPASQNPFAGGSLGGGTQIIQLVVDGRVLAEVVSDRFTQSRRMQALA